MSSTKIPPHYFFPPAFRRRIINYPDHHKMNLYDNRDHHKQYYFMGHGGWGAGILDDDGSSVILDLTIIG